MDVILDGVGSLALKDEISAFAGETQRAFDVVIRVSEFLQGQGRAILGLRINGQPLTPEALASALEGKSAGDISRIEVDSESVVALVSASLADMEAVLPELAQACHRLAEVFQSECPEEGYEPFHQLADVWMVVKTRESQVASALQLELDGIEVGGKTFGQMHGELNGFLTEAAEAIVAGDCVLLGDLLEYELAPRAEAELAIVAIMRAAAERKAAQ